VMGVQDLGERKRRKCEGIMGTRDLTISGEMLISILLKDKEVTFALHRIKCIRGLPEDAVLLDAKCTGVTPDLLLTFRSSQWHGHDLLDVLYQEKKPRIECQQPQQPTES